MIQALVSQFGWLFLFDASATPLKHLRTYPAMKKSQAIGASETSSRARPLTAQTPVDESDETVGPIADTANMTTQLTNTGARGERVNGACFAVIEPTTRAEAKPNTKRKPHTSTVATRPKRRGAGIACVGAFNVPLLPSVYEDEEKQVHLAMIGAYLLHLLRQCHPRAGIVAWIDDCTERSWHRSVRAIKHLLVHEAAVGQVQVCNATFEVLLCISRCQFFLLGSHNHPVIPNMSSR